MSIRSRRCAVVDSTDEFCYSTIGAAVPAASAGDTIRVARGKYFEGDIVMGKSLSRSEAPLAADREPWELLADLNKLLRRSEGAARPNPRRRTDGHGDNHLGFAATNLLVW